MPTRKPWMRSWTVSRTRTWTEDSTRPHSATATLSSAIKARFLNKAFGRKAGEDTIDLPAGEFPEAARLEGILATDDLLGRERALDDLMWTKISELSLFNYFDIDAILAFLAKLHIIDRWFSLDEETGRDMFRSLVDEVRGTFKGVNYVAPKD